MLAINGGEKIRKDPFPAQLTYDHNESIMVNNFMEEFKVLSGYRGSWNKAFMGGEKVKKFEKEWSDYHGGCHSLAVNSCTSALIVACGAIGLKPGDEVIVTPWSMSCSATAPMWWCAIPIFADIEPEKFCLDPVSVESKITDKTKAIIVVDLFGQPFAKEIMDIANKYNLIVIEDAAQAPGAGQNQPADPLAPPTPTGLLGHIGCFSFTQGKHLTCGEGGMITTLDSVLAAKCALIRNHTESVLHEMQRVDRPRFDMTMYSQIENGIGMNLRMTEINAVIMSEQLKKLYDYVGKRNLNAFKIYRELEDIPFIREPKGRHDCDHSFYCQPFLYDNEKAGVHRDKFLAAVNAELTGEEGRPDRPMIGGGYIEPIYKFPLFQNRQHWSIKDIDYSTVILPVVERLYNDDFFLSMYHNLPLTIDDIKDISEAYHKVAENMDEIK
jgi:dTDP-4-amino-4,6-dideoxygalactose transaminase